MLSTTLKPSYIRFFSKASPALDKSTNSFILDRSKCISCGLCVKACKTIAGQNVLKLVKDPDYKQKRVSTASGHLLQNTNCIKCGMCTLVCPTAALYEKDATFEVESVLKNAGDMITTVQTAPASRVVIAEAFGLPAGTVVTGKLVTALKMLGFKYVFDTNWGADMTVVEEATELVNRIKSNSKNLPMFTSCCPAWINYVEESQPELIPNLSTCKSCLAMLAATLRGDFAKEKKIDPRKIYHVAIMPCIAKKDEIERKQLVNSDGIKETDKVVTVRELIRWLKRNKIDLKNLPETPYDKFYGESTGASTIFCNTGGVMEAAIRSAYKFYTGHEMKNYDVKEVRGNAGIRLAKVDFDGTPVHFAVASGTANAMKLIKKIKNKDPEVADVKFVEVMACPGGCVMGGGTNKAKNKKVQQKRTDAIYKVDEEKPERASHFNNEVNECYERVYDGHYFSHLAHETLHTQCKPQNYKV